MSMNPTAISIRRIRYILRYTARDGDGVVVTMEDEIKTK